MSWSNSKRLFSSTARGLFALLLAFAATSASKGADSDPKVAVVAFGLFGDQSVFESEAKGAAQIVADRFGGSPVIVRANTKSRSDATVETLATTLKSAAKEIDVEKDILVLILTSHGSPAGLAVKAGRREETLSPSNLVAMLNDAGLRHRVVIVSACYSGIFIPRLADADTLVITAADSNHSSFGCQDKAKWTYFGDAFFNSALRRTTNLRDALALAQVFVRKRERQHHFIPSAIVERSHPRRRGPMVRGEPYKSMQTRCIGLGQLGYVTACCVWDLSLAHAEKTAQKQRGDWPAAKAQPLRIIFGALTVLPGTRRPWARWAYLPIWHPALRSKVKKQNVLPICFLDQGLALLI
jgi:hypothetical protein